MGINWRGSADDDHVFEEEAGASGTTRPVHGLPSSTVSTFGAIKAAVEALAALISASKLAVSDASAATKLDTLHADLAALAGYIDGLEGFTDGIEAKLDTLHADLGTIDGRVDGLEGFTDGIEALIASTNTKLDTLHAYVDGIETLITSTNTKLDTLHADVDGLEGYLDTVEAKLQSLIDVYAVPTPKGGNNSDVDTSYEALSGSSVALVHGLYIQNTSVLAQVCTISLDGGTTDCWQLQPGQVSNFIECNNANVPYVKMSANNGTLNWNGS